MSLSNPVDEIAVRGLSAVTLGDLFDPSQHRCVAGTAAALIPISRDYDHDERRHLQ